MHNRGALAGRKNGWKRHAFGPGTTRLVFHGGGNRDLRHARPNFAACNPEETGAKLNRPPNAQDLGSVLHHTGALDQRRRGTQARLSF